MDCGSQCDDRSVDRRRDPADEIEIVSAHAPIEVD